MTRTEKAIKMVFGSIINQTTIVLAGLILPPLIIQNYGSATNGLVNSVKQLLSYFSIATVGLGAAGQIALYKPLAKKNYKKINKIMSELSQFLNKLSFVFAFFVGILAFILPIIRKDELNYGMILSIVLICGLGSLIEFKVLQKYKILLQADQKQYISSNINSQGTIVNLILSVVLIKLDAPIVAVQLIATFAYVVRMLLMMKQIKRIYPFLDINEKMEKGQIPKQKEAFLYKMAEIILNYISMTLVTIIFSFADASIYSVYNTIFSAIGMIVSIFSNGFASSFGNLLIEEKNEKLKKAFNEYTYIYRTMAMWIYTCAAILIIPFVSIYIRNNDGINYIIPFLGLLFALNGLFKNIRVPSTTIVDAMGKFSKRNIILNYIEVTMNIIFSIVFSFKFGLCGILIGSTISSLFRSLIFIYDIDKTVMNKSFINNIILLGINMAVATLLYYVFDNIKVTGYFDWIVEAIKIACISGGSFFIINLILDYSSYKEFKTRIRSLLKQRRHV